MITINAAPSANKIILDGNDTIISVTSSNGVGHYFRAEISIDDELFDTQSWSRFDNYSANKNLKALYKDYFETVFNQTFTPGVTEQTHLKKKVSITIKEFLMSDDTEVALVTLADFYVMYNAKPASFSDSVKAAFLGLDAPKMLVPVNGKISVPVYTNTASQTVVFTLKDNFNNTVHTHTVSSGTAKKIFLYNFDLSNHTFAELTTHFILSVTVGSTTITQAYRYLKHPDFTVKEIAFLNNFGYFVYAYLDGQLSIDKGLNVESFEQEGGIEKVFEINEEDTYTINTGSLLASEKAIISQIATSLQTKLFYNNAWLELVTNIKKVKTYQDRLNNYSESLLFKLNSNKSVANNFYEEIEDPVINFNDLESTDARNFTFYFDLNFPLYNLVVQGKVGDDWLDAENLPTTSPATIYVPFYCRIFRLKSIYNGVSVYSNEINNPFASWESSE
jgi:hypothetical protein